MKSKPKGGQPVRDITSQSMKGMDKRIETEINLREFYYTDPYDKDGYMPFLQVLLLVLLVIAAGCLLISLVPGI